MSQKKIRNISFPELEISLFWPNFNKPTNRWIDKQEIWNVLKLVYKNPRNASKHFKKMSHPEFFLKKSSLWRKTYEHTYECQSKEHCLL